MPAQRVWISMARNRSDAPLHKDVGPNRHITDTAGPIPKTFEAVDSSGGSCREVARGFALRSGLELDE